MKRIYLDNIAGTPIHPEVKEAMIPFLEGNYGNPQSLHSFGAEVNRAVKNAREKTASLINCTPEEIFFTSSGTESNNFALKGIAWANQKKGNHIIISAIEHQSILHSAKALERMGFKTSIVPVDKFGLVSPDDVAKSITSETILVSIMLANSEVGTIEPVKDIAKIVKEKGIVFHTDAVGAVGNIPVDVNELGVDLLSLSGSQFYGPKGAAALFIKKGVRVLPFIDGGIQEEGRRAGTENVSGIVGLGKAAEMAKIEIPGRMAYLSALRNRMIKELPEKIKNIYVTGHPENRLPHHASFCIEFIEGEAMLLRLDMEGIAVSSGSACTSRALKTSHVLVAMKIPAALAQGSIVFSLNIFNTNDDVDFVLKVFPPIVDLLRKMSPLYQGK
ncbi:MAG: cysteine desulfurase family protein [bacterium]|nr:cysteine desulfurase family protein [bacterium]